MTLTTVAGLSLNHFLAMHSNSWRQQSLLTMLRSGLGYAVPAFQADSDELANPAFLLSWKTKNVSTPLAILTRNLYNCSV